MQSIEDKLDELFNEVQGIKTTLKKQKKSGDEVLKKTKSTAKVSDKKEKRRAKKVAGAVAKVAKELISSDGKIIFYRLPKKEFVDIDGSRVTLYKTYSLKKPAKAPSYSLKAIDYEKRIIKNNDGTSTEEDRLLSRIVSPKLLDVLKQQFNLDPVTVNEPVLPVAAVPVAEPEAVEEQQQ